MQLKYENILFYCLKTCAIKYRDNNNIARRGVSQEQ